MTEPTVRNVSFGNRARKPYPKYKDSEIEWLGEIPAHWEAVPAKWLAQIVNGATPRSSELSYWDGEIAWATPDDLGQLHTRLLEDTSRHITEAGYVNCGTTLIPAGSLVLSTRAPIGHLAVAGRELCMNQGCRGLVLGEHDSSLYRYYSVLAAKPVLQSLGEGSTFRELPRDTLANVVLPNPPLDERNRIAEFLDRETAKTDALVEKKERLIELLWEKRTALITHTVTKGLPAAPARADTADGAAAQAGLNPDVPMKDTGTCLRQAERGRQAEWLGQIPAHWEIRPLKADFVFRKGRNAQELTASYIKDHPGEFPVYSGQTENAGLMGTIDSYEYEIPEVILTTTVGARVMTPMIVGGRFSLSQNCLIMIPKDQFVVSRFFFFQLYPCFAYERASIPDHMQPSLRVSDLLRYRMAVPPVDEQQAIADYLDRETAKIGTLIAKVSEAIERLKEYRTALISAAVTGKIDVRNK